MKEKTKSQFKLKKLDAYSVIVTLVAVALVTGTAALFAGMYARAHTESISPPGQLVPICNCPMIPAGREPALACRCQ